MSSRGSIATPIVGVAAVVELTPIAGGSTVTLKNSKYKLMLKSNIKEAPNTTDGMLRAVGLYDYTGSIEGSTDSTSGTTAIEGQALPGQVWDFKIYRSKTANTYFGGTLILGETLSIESGVDMAESWSFDFARAYGALTLPGGGSF